MDDRFKFRAWDGEVLSHISNLSWRWGTVVTEARIGENGESVNKYKIMQSTGLRDKNGKLIYEGDIVVSKTDNDEDRWVIDMDELYWMQSPKGHSFDNKWIEFEIIGNIYENPDFLDSKDA